MPETTTTETAEAEVVRVWTDPGPRVSDNWHRRQQDEVRRQMPQLARALDRLAAEAAR